MFNVYFLMELIIIAIMTIAVNYICQSPMDGRRFIPGIVIISFLTNLLCCQIIFYFFEIAYVYTSIVFCTIHFILS
jgi:hypothetical protein